MSTPTNDEGLTAEQLLAQGRIDWPYVALLSCGCFRTFMPDNTPGVGAIVHCGFHSPSGYLAEVIALAPATYVPESQAAPQSGPYHPNAPGSYAPNNPT